MRIAVNSTRALPLPLSPSVTTNGAPVVFDDVENRPRPPTPGMDRDPPIRIYGEYFQHSHLLVGRCWHTMAVHWTIESEYYDMTYKHRRVCLDMLDWNASTLGCDIGSASTSNFLLLGLDGGGA